MHQHSQRHESLTWYHPKKIRVRFRTKRLLWGLSSGMKIKNNRQSIVSLHKQSDSDLVEPLLKLDVGEETLTDQGWPTSEEIAASRAKSARVILNVGGEKHEVLWKTLQRLPCSRLGKLINALSHLSIMSLCDDYNLDTNEYFFDRQPQTFGCILNLYRTGHLHIIDDLCILSLTNDLEFWEIEEQRMEPCCLGRYFHKKEQIEDEIRKINEIFAQQPDDEYFGDDKCAACRKILWDILEKPQTSRTARVFSLISVTFILLSTIGLALNTIPELATHTENSTLNNTKGLRQSIESDNVHLDALETVCIVWFTIEYVMRFTVAPYKCEFLKSAMNTIDIIAILPYYLSKLIEVLVRSHLEPLVAIRKIVQVFRLLRVLRILKLARHSIGLQSLGFTLRRSYKELGLLMMFVAMGVLIFSSLAYFAEKDENQTQFYSIPASFWWAIITMTTVGYGDMSPKTVFGKIIGSGCSLCGVLVLALPIPIIVNNFAEFYKDQKRRDKVIKRQEDMQRLQQNINPTTASLEVLGIRLSGDNTSLGINPRRSLILSDSKLGINFCKQNVNHRLSLLSLQRNSKL